MTVTIEIDDVAPGLNGSQGLMRMHYHNKTKLKKKWMLLIRSKTLYKFKGKVTINYYRSSVMPPDADNLSASFKFIGDALVDNGVISDDSMDVVTRFTAHWMKAKNNKDKRTVIVISDEG
jgi:Holliday junction resolvase RusA-like endonuclease